MKAKTERRLRIEEILGTELSDSEYKSLIVDWHKFYCDFETYANSIVVEMITTVWLQEIRNK